MPPIPSPSSYTWGQLFDYTARRAGNSASFPAADQLLIVQAVSSFAYDRYLWPFTLTTTPTGSIPCQPGQQDYPAPDDCYRLSRAWFRVPTLAGPFAPVPYTGDGALTPPLTNGPYDDPATLAQTTAALSAQYVGTLGYPVGNIPAAITWPADGSLSVVKRLPVNLVTRSYPSIRAISQEPGSMLRLEAATAVTPMQPWSLELEYQLKRDPVNALTESPWFPDSYLAIAEEGIRYRIYRDTNDSRAGTVTFVEGRAAYSGQLAVWMSALDSAAQAERAGSVDAITPSASLGASGYDGLGWGGSYG